jgi:putative transposase
MQDNTAILEPDGIYHIYNRANGSELLFLSDDNYRYFLEKFNQYIHPVADVFCYCLMPNHFHFLVRIKPERDIIEIIEKWKFHSTKTLQGFQTSEGERPDRFPKPVRSQGYRNLQGYQNLEGLTLFISLQFSNFFNAYSKAFNKQNNRRGSLFIRPFKRKRIDSETYLRKVIHYIHYNPLEAGLAEKPEDWKYSSYKAIITPNSQTAVLKDEVISYFDDLSNFIYCHSYPPDETGIDFR